MCNINAPSDSTASNALRSLFANNPRIVSFDIHHNYFHHEALCRFFISLREAPVLLLTRLDLDSVGVGSVSMKDLVSTVNRCPQLVSISLRKNAIGGGPLSSLLKGLRHNSKLTSLNLARSKLRESDIRTLGDYLRESRIVLRELDISDNSLKSSAIDAIVSSWNRNKTLSTLWIGQNEFTPNDISRFMRFIASLNNWRLDYPAQDGSDPVYLSNLDLSDMRVFGHRSQVQDLSTLMCTPTANISRLILVNSGFTIDSSKALVAGVKESKTLEFLDLRFSEMSNDVMTELALHYSTSPVLSRLLIDFPDSRKLLRTKLIPGLHLQEIPDSVLHATHLVKLSLRDNRLTSLPEDFTKLTELVSLDLRNNYLEFLPSSMGWMTHLKKLRLDGNPLRTPPAELRASAGDKPAKILGYLRDLSAGHETIYRAKLMLVGQENVGKTSLLAALRRKLGGKPVKPSKSPKFGRTGTTPNSLVRTRSGKLEHFVSTDGIDIHELHLEAPMPVRRESSSSSNANAPFLRKTSASSPLSSSSSSALNQPTPGSFGTGRMPSSSWTTTYEKRTVTLSTWDFGGQAIYYSTHQFFLSDQAVFLVVWDLRYEEDVSHVGFWLQSIQSRARNASVIIVGTHVDDFLSQAVNSAGSGSVSSNTSSQNLSVLSSHTGHGSAALARKLEGVRQKYRKYTMVKAVVAVNCLSNDLGDLIGALVAVLQDLNGMGVPIPSSHLALARFIRLYRQANDTQREEMVSSYGTNGLDSPPSSATTSPRASPRSGPSPPPQHALGAGQPSPSTARLSVSSSSSRSGPRRTSSNNLLVPNSSPPSARTVNGKHPHTPHHQQFKHGLPGSVSSTNLSAAAEAFSTPASLPYKTWSEFAKLASFCNIADGPDLKRCVETLSMMGDVMYFDDPKGGLDDLVILDSQFLTQVMATIITTKQNYIKNGVINFNDLRHIWKPPLFPVSIHPLLLTLLQKFEIVYVADEKLVKRLVEYFDVSPAVKAPSYPLGGLGVIPSLLPEEVPPLDILWSRYDDKIQQFDRQYVFDVMPMGLFSRLLFRLLNSASDVLHCWRYGAILVCGDSLCLVEQNAGLTKQTISITMRGGRSPSEQLRTLSDVIEALIMGDTWWKTQVKKRITCPVCLAISANPAIAQLRQGFSPRSLDDELYTGSNPNNAKGGSSESLRSGPSKGSSGDVPLPAPVPYHPGAGGSGSSIDQRGEVHRTRSTSTSPSPANTHSAGEAVAALPPSVVPPPIGAAPAFRRGSSFNLRTPAAPEAVITPTKLQRRSQRAIRLSSDSSSTANATTASISLGSDNINQGNDGGSTETLSGLVSGSGSAIHLSAHSHSESGYDTATDAIGNRRPPSIGQIRMAKEKTNSSKTTSSTTTNGSGGSAAKESSFNFGGSLSSFHSGGSSITTASSSDSIASNGPCYFAVDECIRIASLNRAYITCAAGHLVRLDRVAPDIALADFDRFKIVPTDLQMEQQPFAKGSYGLIYRALYTHDAIVVPSTGKPSRSGLNRSTSLDKRSAESARGHVFRQSDPDDPLLHASYSSSEETDNAVKLSRDGSKVTEMVAVKQIQALDPSQVSGMYNDFAREIWTMSGLMHPNLVNLLGFYLDPVPSMVMEYIEGGDLYSFLHEHDDTIVPGDEIPKLPSAVILKLALDIANGMNFLHAATPPFIHRDLKTPNIMVTRTVNDPGTDIAAKVADFGLTNRMVIPLRKEGRLDRAVTNPTWQAPEILREEEFSEKSDVYAYGLILWELYTRSHPYSELNSSFLYEIEDAALSGMRPAIPADCPEEYSRLVVACWADNPQDRPTFPLILEELHSMIEKSGLGTIIHNSPLAPQAPTSSSRKHFHRGESSLTAARTSTPSSASSSPPLIGVPAPIKSGKRRRTPSSNSSLSSGSVTGLSAKPFRLPPKIDEVASQEMDSGLDARSVHGEEGATSSEDTSPRGPLAPPRVESVATMMKRRNSRARHPEDDFDDSEVPHGDTPDEIEEDEECSSKLEGSTSSYHSTPSDQVSKRNKPYTRSNLHRSGSSLEGQTVFASTSSSPSHPLRLASNLSASSTSVSSASPLPEVPLSTSRPLLPIPRIDEAEPSEEEEEESEDEESDPLPPRSGSKASLNRRNKSGSSSSSDSSSSEDTELLSANPALAVETAAVSGRFAKVLQTTPGTRLNSILQVGNSQIWATGRDGSVHIWNAKNGNLIATHPQAHNGAISSTAYVLDTVWMSCPKTSTLGVWYVRMNDQGNRVEKRSGTLLVAHLNKDGSKASHWRSRFVIINFKDGSLKVFSSKENKSSETISFTSSTPGMAPIKELSLINTPSNPVTFGLALDISQRAFKVTSGATTLFFEVEQENDMLEWLDCISSISSSDRLICLTKFTNEWTQNIGLIHTPSIKGELLITASNDAEMLVVSWNVQTKKVIRSTKLSQHAPQRSDESDSATASNSSTTGVDNRSSTGSRRSSPEPRSRSSSAIFGVSPKQMRITSILTLPKRGHTLVAAGPLIFILATKSLDVVRVIRTSNLERPNVHSPILAMALTRPKEMWTASKSGTITAWETSSFTPIARFQAPASSRIRCIMPVSSSAVWTSGDDGIIRIWDSASHTLLSELTGHHNGPIRSMVAWYHSVWSASFDKTVCIWT